MANGNMTLNDSERASMDGRREKTIKATASLTPMKEHKGTRVTSKSVRCVALLPVRYALGDAPSRTPKLTSPFEIEGVGIPGTTDTNYTLRRQRPGYVYVFHEKYQGWSLFKVEPGVHFEGKLYNGGLFTEIENPEPGFEGVHLRCTIHGLMLVEEDDVVWIAFSNHLWSPRILAGNREHAGLRAAHMRRFDPLNWTNEKHTGPLGQADRLVADLTSGMSDKAFWFSNTDFFQLPPSVLRKTLPASKDSKQHPGTANWKPAEPSPEARVAMARMSPPPPSGSYRVAPGTMLDQMGKPILKPSGPPSSEKRPVPVEERYVPTQPELDRGALIALDDPVGIVMDFRCLMAGRLNRFLTEPERARRISCHHAINTLRANFLSYGEKRYWEEKPKSLSRAALALAEAQEQDEIARQAKAMGVNPVQTPAYQASFKARHAREAAYERTIYTKVQTARWEAWKPYDDKVNWKTLNQWPEKLSQQYDTCRIKELDPLAEAHAAWMQSALLGKVFKHHFHSSDLDKEGRYAALARLCIEGTQGWKACRDLYGQWVRTESLAPGNILLRGFLNNDAQLLAEARKLPAPAGLDFNTFISQIFIPAVTQKIADLGTAATEQRKALAGEVQGVLAELMGECMEKDQGHLSMAVMAASEGVGLRLVTFKDTNLTDVIRSLAESVQAENPELTAAAAKTSVLRMFSKYDPKLLGNKDTTRWVFGFNYKQMSEVGVTGTAYGAILPWDDLAKLPQSRWECFKASGGRFGVAALVCQTASLWMSLKSFKDVPLWKETEEGWRLRAGVLAWASTLATTTYSVVAPSIALGLKQAWHFVGFKILGVMGAGVFGIVDLCKAIEAYKAGDTGLSWLYGFSLASGVASAILLAGFSTAAWVPMVGWAMLCLFMGIQVAITLWKEGKVQDWFKHCVFGTEPGFKDGAEELAELKAAMGWK